MKSEETENLNLQYVNKIHTSLSQKNNKQDSDTELAEKITQILNIYEKNSIFKGKPSVKIWCKFCRRNALSIAECRQNNRITKTNHRNIENQINHF